MEIEFASSTMSAGRLHREIQKTDSPCVICVSGWPVRLFFHEWGIPTFKDLGGFQFEDKDALSVINNSKNVFMILGGRQFSRERFNEIVDNMSFSGCEKLHLFANITPDTYNDFEYAKDVIPEYFV